jgi:hypothetical protein
VSAPIIDLYLVYEFIKRLVVPFEKTKAFQLGLIDNSGKTIRSPKTSEEKAAFGYFDRIIFNLKKLIEKVPGGKSRIATYAAAILLMREQRGDNILENRLLDNVFQEHIDMLPDVTIESIMNILSEDGVVGGAPANAAGGGNVAGIGVNKAGKAANWGEPGAPQRRLIRRKPVVFAGTRVFEVDNSTFHGHRNVKNPYHRYSKYIDEDNYGEEVREYARENPHAAVLLRNSATGAMRFLRYGKNPMRFGEQTEDNSCPTGKVYYKAIRKYVCKAKSGSSKGGNGDGD